MRAEEIGGISGNSGDGIPSARAHREHATSDPRELQEEDDFRRAGFVGRIRMFGGHPFLAWTYQTCAHSRTP